MKKWGGWAVEVFRCCKTGAHKGYAGDLKDLIAGSNKLSARIGKAS